jgi:hypothetical protein
MVVRAAMAITGPKFRVVRRNRMVAEGVALPGLHERVVGAEALLHHVGPAVEPAYLLALGHQRAVGGRGEERGHPGPARPHPLGHRALRVELDLDLSGQGHLLEDLVLGPRSFATIFLTCPFWSRIVIPKSLVPALLLIMVSFLAP